MTEAPAVVSGADRLPARTPRIRLEPVGAPVRPGVRGASGAAAELDPRYI